MGLCYVVCVCVYVCVCVCVVGGEGKEEAIFMCVGGRGGVT